MAEAVIFDMDGVLIDSEPLHYRTDTEMLAKLGISEGPDYLNRFVGTSNPEMWRAILDEHGIDREIDGILNAQLSLKLKLLKAEEWKPIDGIPELFRALRKYGVPIAVASSSSAIFIKEALKRIRLLDFVDVYVSGESVEHGKPEPDVFLRAAEMIGAEPRDCVVVEDSRNGVLAAKRAGMRCVGFQNPKSGDQDLSAASLVVDSFVGLSIATLFG